MRLTLLLGLAFICFFGSLSLEAKDGWVLEVEKEGVRVYTQLEEGSPYKQIKVTTTINASMEKVMEILMEFSQYRIWMNNVTESYLINHTDSTYYVFTLEDAAWPMQNRYHVSKINVESSSSSSKVKFKSVPNYIDKRKDAIQIKQYEGYWALQSRPNRQCSLEYVLVQNPGGHVPPWLANFNAVENPFLSIMKLKRLAEQELIRP